MQSPTKIERIKASSDVSIRISSAAGCSPRTFPACMHEKQGDALFAARHFIPRGRSSRASCPAGRINKMCFKRAYRVLPDLRAPAVARSVSRRIALDEFAAVRDRAEVTSLDSRPVEHNDVAILTLHIDRVGDGVVRSNSAPFGFHRTRSGYRPDAFIDCAVRPGLAHDPAGPEF